MQILANFLFLQLHLNDQLQEKNKSIDLQIKNTYFCTTNLKKINL